MSVIDELDYYESVDRAIFEHEFADWLPPRIFDVHTHSWLLAHNLRPLDIAAYGLVFEAQSTSWEDLADAYRLMFPGKTVEWLAFGMPLPDVDRQANNDYIAAQVDNHQTFGLLIPGLDDTPEQLWDSLRQKRLIGFKPYLAYVTWKPREEIRITDFLRPAQLEIAHAHRLPIMLHVPRNGRLADKDNLADLEYIARHYPDAIIILAHAGRAYARSLMDTALDVIADLPNMWIEYSNVQAEDVVRATLERMPIDRLMYGSDIPVATVRGKLLMLNGQRVAITRKTYPWSISTAEPNQLRCTFMGYEQIRAMKAACEAVGVGHDGVEKLFYSNARNLVLRSLASITG